MALTQPTNLFPSSFRGSGGDVIDASVNNTFSLQINGTSACVAYSAVIMQNDTASTVVYTIAKTTLATPIYPRNYKNEPQRLEFTVPSTSGMTNGYANGYKWNVTLYWNSTDSITSADTVFLTQAAPYFTVGTVPATVTTKAITLTATYTQADGVPLEWYQWTLEDARGTLIADMGKIYSNDIRFDLDGLISGEVFTYTLTGETQSGVTVPTETGTFTVSYNEPAVEGVVTTSCNKRTGSVTVAFPLLRVITGTALNGNYRYITDEPVNDETCIEIDSGNKITFDTVNSVPMDFDDDATHIYSGRPTGNATLYEYTEIDADSNTTKGLLTYNGSNLVYTYGGTVILTIPVSDFFVRWAIAIMHKDTAIIQIWVLDDALFPAQNLYPSETLYPNGGTNWAVEGRYTA